MAVHLNYTVLSIMACATSSCREKHWIQSMYAIQIFSGKVFKIIISLFKFYDAFMVFCQAQRISSLVYEDAENKYL